MKLEMDNAPKTVLDDNAAIYAKRETRDEKTKFRNLHGKEKFRFFCDYILGKIIIGLVIAGIIFAILYSSLKPKPEVMYSVVVMDNPFSLDAKEALSEQLNALFVSDPEKQSTLIDYDYFVSTDSYDTRLKLMAQLTVGEIDCIIMPSYEVKTYSDSDIFVDLRTVLPAELLPSDSSTIIKTTDSETGQQIYAALDISKQISLMNGYDYNVKYYLICVATSKYQDRFKDFVQLLPVPEDY